MITPRITVGCDGCPAAFDVREEVRTPAAALAVARAAGWGHRLSGRLLCPSCADRARCLRFGHDFGPDLARTWRVCGCGGSLWENSTCEPWQDPGLWEGCGWERRLCRRCDHIEDRHVTAATAAADRRADEQAARTYDAALERGHLRPQPLRSNGNRSVDQPGDGILADVAAGLALPNQHSACEETAMVEPNEPQPATRTGGEER